ncbi:uracil-DNA glycosylase family protein [Enterococcus hulanensis]|uniref:uracil-DNA glycosylase family protein n=1 Tax=Enterococcus hulanensis TaxID=2559929 RepID=UPI001A8C462D|nr:uracil-DNA glycosylase family protein [Enterococcus hulanensis]MBO0455570.1 uracil-DNA glycosylase family protein [Enterococcus hulanensis]
MNIKQEIEKTIEPDDQIRLNDITIDPLSVKAIMINEVVPAYPENDFYGSEDAAYLETTIPLFQKAGIEVSNIQEILEHGIYITNAIKTPKTETTIDNAAIERSLPYLETELALFPNVKVIMLMGDVAKKCFNRITKKATKKNAVPAISTYKLRHSELFYQTIRIMPSYIMTGKNILIEKSKVQMVAEDLAIMFEIISD